MATFSKLPLSASTNGKGILVNATSSPGTLIHTAITGTTNFDEVWLYAMNNHTSVVTLDIQYGGTSSSDQIELAIPSKSGLVLVVPGIYLNNSLEVRAFSNGLPPNVITIHGFVNRVS